MMTQKEIASTLGVSQKTVSRVVNGSSEVRQETREKILALLGKSRYAPNANARNLTRKQSGALGVLVAGSQAFQSIYFLQTFRGINEVVNDHHYHLYFSVLEERSELDPALLQADGFIIFNILDIGPILPSVMRTINAVGKARLVVQSTRQGRDPFITVDNYQGGLEAIRYLLRLRHQRIAFFGMIDGNSEGCERLRGYRAALKEGGILPDPARVFDLADRRLEECADAILSLSLEDRPTAVFCWSDHTARVLILHLQRRGLSVPGDLSVMGFDDRPDLVNLTPPAITTMRQPFYELGRRAGELLFTSLCGGEMERKSLILPELVIRDSCRALE